MLYIWTKRIRVCSIYSVPRIKHQPPIQLQLEPAGGKQYTTNTMTSSFEPLDPPATHEVKFYLIGNWQVIQAANIQHAIARNPGTVKKLMGPRKTFMEGCQFFSALFP